MKGFNIPLIVKKIRQSLAIVENGSTASRNIAVGKYVLWKGDLYTVKTAITSGDTLSSTNLDSVSDGGLNSLSSKFKYIPNVSFTFSNSTSSTILIADVDASIANAKAILPLCTTQGSPLVASINSSKTYLSMQAFSNVNTTLLVNLIVFF